MLAFYLDSGVSMLLPNFASQNNTKQMFLFTWNQSGKSASLTFSPCKLL